MLKYIDELDSLRLKQSGGVYERQETRLIKQLLKPDSIFVDVGAHIGYHSFIASQVIKTGFIYAFEPDPTNHELLMKNLNGKASTFKIAIGEIPGRNKLYISDRNTGDHRLFATPKEKRKNIDVDIARLDDFRKGGHIDFLKIDTQGFEIEVLRSGKKIINNSPDINILVEYSPALLRLACHSPGELIGLLIDWNFHIYQKDNGKWRYADTEIYHHKKGKFHTNLFCSRRRFNEIDWGC